MTAQKPPQFARKRLTEARDKLGDLNFMLDHRLPDDNQARGVVKDITACVEDALHELTNAVCDAEFALNRL